MTLTPLTDAVEVKHAFGILAAQIKKGAKRKVSKIGWQGGGGEYPLYWHEQERIWVLVEPKEEKNRYWCCFGTANPYERDNCEITCEINPPREGINRRVAGMFVRDDAGVVYLAHSGKLGGGRKRIGKSAFLPFLTTGSLSRVTWPDGNESDAVVIGDIADKTLFSRIAKFVHEAERFKNAVTSGDVAIPKPTAAPAFTPEFSGLRRPYKHAGTIRSICRHGDVVNMLADLLRESGRAVSKDTARDVFILGANGDASVLFEVKTDLASSSIYGAVGQLIINGAGSTPEPKRVLVVPGKPNAKTRTGLAKYGIEVLSYGWRDGAPIFKRLDALLKRVG